MRSASSVAAAVAPLLVTATLLLVPTVLAQSPQPAAAPAVRMVVQSSPLAGFAHYEAARLWPQLQVGDPLTLIREADNPHDPDAVRVLWRHHTLGYLPRRANGALAWALDRGERLQARIAALEPHPNPARRLLIEVLLE